MKAKNVLMIFAIVVMTVIFTNCHGSITGPDNPPPPEKTYTLQIQYIRTYANPDTILLTPGLLLFDLSANRSVIPMYRTDDYHFNGELGGVKVRADYYFCCSDGGRYDGSDSSSTMVGDIFKVTIKETGITYELKDIQPYTLSTNPYPGPKAKAAFFQLTSDGTIISN